MVLFGEIAMVVNLILMGWLIAIGWRLLNKESYNTSLVEVIKVLAATNKANSAVDAATAQLMLQPEPEVVKVEKPKPELVQGLKLENGEELEFLSPVTENDLSGVHKDFFVRR